jgi:hypothetical protein
MRKPANGPEAMFDKAVFVDVWGAGVLVGIFHFPYGGAIVRQTLKTRQRAREQISRFAYNGTVDLVENAA